MLIDYKSGKETRPPLDRMLFQLLHFSQVPGRRLRKERDWRSLGLSLSACNTIPCLGQTQVKLYTLSMQRAITCACIYTN